MRTFERVLLIIALLLLNVFAARHVYHRWIEPRGSVLDAFQKPVDQTIKNAKSLNELVDEYRQAKASADALRKEHENEDNGAWRRNEVLNSETQLEQAITDWETKMKEVYELRVYWVFGLLAVVAGTILHLYRSKWLGLGLLATGFSELIYWTSPSWRGGAVMEYDRLLINKMIFSFLSIAVLLAVASILKLIKDDEPQTTSAP